VTAVYVVVAADVGALGVCSNVAAVSRVAAELTACKNEAVSARLAVNGATARLGVSVAVRSEEVGEDVPEDKELRLSKELAAEGINEPEPHVPVPPAP
jgi:hypothetical protein